jgi:5-hydroxyisourate hydrolase-like protein (transthyretin family)
MRLRDAHAGLFSARRQGRSLVAGLLLVAVATLQPVTPSGLDPAGAAGAMVAQAADDGVLRPGDNPISGLWANDGGRKIVSDEIRSEAVADVRNGSWDGLSVTVDGARNETVGFNLILEAADSPVTGASVEFDRLDGPGGYAITTDPDAGLFEYGGRDIELFYVRYLQIRGISNSLSYDTYEESHVPEMLRLPPGGSSWSERPYADSYFPDILAPIELHPTFDIAQDTNQSIWVDVYVPPDAPAGRYTGTITVNAAGGAAVDVPVELDVHDFALPDEATAATAVVVSYPDIARRYTGERYPLVGSAADDRVQEILDEHYKMARRHRLTLVGGDGNANATWLFENRPASYLLPHIDGSAYTAANDYRGPGIGLPTDYYWIGLYGGWRNWGISQQEMWSRTDAWETWFAENAPNVERSLYLIDEPDAAGIANAETWSQWVDDNPGPGSALPTFSTIRFTKAASAVPSLDISASWIALAETAKAEAAIAQLRAEGKQVWMYNGIRPASGSFAPEDDGVALRELAWGQYKHDVDRWFYWQSTYYDDFQGGRGEIDLFNVAQTFGGATSPHPRFGQRGWNATNGDGVLFYPGSDAIFTDESYGVDGPLASLRLKLWRRGIQDVEYLELARAIDSDRVDAIVQRMVPRVLWEVDAQTAADPTYTLLPPSWSTDPADWEAARAELVEIILAGGGGGGGGGGGETGATLSGTIDAAGSPEADVAVDLFASNSDGQRLDYLRSTATDASGSYEFEVDAGCYAITMIAPQGRQFTNGLSWSNTASCVDDGDSDDSLDAELVAAGLLASLGDQVTYSDGQPAEGVSIDLFTSPEAGVRAEFLRSTRTDASGRYEFLAGEGCYIATFIAPADETFVDLQRYLNLRRCVTAGQTVDDLDAVLAAQPEAGLAGTVTRAGAGVGGVQVDVFVAGADGSRQAFLGTVDTDADGSWQFPIPAGCFIITFIAPEGETFTNGSRWLNGPACAPSGATVTGLDAELS